MFKFRFCFVIDNPTIRQKMMMTRILRDSKSPAIAMDEHNAAKQNLVEQAEKIILLRPFVGECPKQVDYVTRLKSMGWTRDRVIVETVDFPLGCMPDDPVFDHCKKVAEQSKKSDSILRSDEEWDSLNRDGVQIPERVVAKFGRGKE